MKNKKGWIFLIAVIFLIGTAFIPTGYDVLLADEPLSLDEYVLYEDGYAIDGELAMTYVVTLQNTGWPYLLLGMMEEGSEMVKATSEILNISEEEIHIQNLRMMGQSRVKAEFMAKKYLGEEPDVELKGFYPVQYVPDWPYKDEFKVTDLLVGMDGVALQSLEQFEQLLAEKEPDEEVALTLLRDGELVEVYVRTYRERDYYRNTILGVYVEEVLELEQDQRIKLITEDIGGPSAGLMMTLALIEKMTEEPLLKGFKVAGTGTIERNGEIGPIGGVRQKVIGADLAGYDYFLVPADVDDFSDNEMVVKQTVEEEGLSIKIIPVATLDEAVDALRALPEKK